MMVHSFPIIIIIIIVIILKKKKLKPLRSSILRALFT